jgi:DNA-binding FadR family transcriptional regulator
MANENKRRNYYEKLQELNGSIEDGSFAEQSDIPLENNLPRDFL